ncbi:hypothetical protein DOT_4950 [Desulfosporosinus sp. OT]|nr:hypothetical protein DOT_4950 [Desulfosporosinus sp. OT]
MSRNKKGNMAIIQNKVSISTPYLVPLISGTDKEKTWLAKAAA